MHIVGHAIHRRCRAIRPGRVTSVSTRCLTPSDKWSMRRAWSSKNLPMAFFSAGLQHDRETKSESALKTWIVLCCSASTGSMSGGGRSAKVRCNFRNNSLIAGIASSRLVEIPSSASRLNFIAGPPILAPPPRSCWSQSPRPPRPTDEAHCAFRPHSRANCSASTQRRRERDLEPGRVFPSECATRQAASPPCGASHAATEAPFATSAPLWHPRSTAGRNNPSLA
jgi:hypothetical protein